MDKDIEDLLVSDVFKEYMKKHTNGSIGDSYKALLKEMESYIEEELKDVQLTDETRGGVKRLMEWVDEKQLYVIGGKIVWGDEIKRTLKKIILLDRYSIEDKELLNELREMYSNRMVQKTPTTILNIKDTWNSKEWNLVMVDEVNKLEGEYRFYFRPSYVIPYTKDIIFHLKASPWQLDTYELRNTIDDQYMLLRTDRSLFKFNGFISLIETTLHNELKRIIMSNTSSTKSIW
jgi:hypothetical protein